MVISCMKDDDKKESDYNLHKSLERLSQNLSKEGFTLSLDELEYLKDQIDHEHINARKIKDFNDNIKNIINYMSEFLDTFIILGYDFEGNRVVFQNHNDSTLKQDALFKLIEQTFIKFVQKHRGGDFGEE